MLKRAGARVSIDALELQQGHDADEMRTTPRWVKAVAVITGVMALLLVLCFAAGWVVVRHFDEAIGGEWSTLPLPERTARDVFGIEHLPPVVLQTQRREGGFQDAMYDALLRVTPESAEAFVAANGLERASESYSGSVDQFEVRIRESTSPKGVMRVTPLTGARQARLSDGGAVTEYRNAALLEFDDQTWVALEAFDT